MDDQTFEHDRAVIFVIGPADSLYGQVLSVIEEAFPKNEVVDWGKAAQGGSATAWLVTQLFDSDVVIADLHGNKPNVFYEIGVAHVFSTPVVCVSDTPDDIPFDLADLQVLGMVVTGGEIKQRDVLQRSLRATTDHALRHGQITPVSAAGLTSSRPPRGLTGMPDASAVWATLAHEQIVPRLQPHHVELDVDIFHTKHGVGRISAFSRPNAGPIRITVAYLSGRQETTDVPSARLYLAELDDIRR